MLKKKKNYVYMMEHAKGPEGFPNTKDGVG